MEVFKLFKSNISKALKEAKELSLTSTAYGLPNVLRSRRLLNKLFWLSYLILSATGAAYYIYFDVVDFLDYEVVTVIQTEYDQPTQFPTVTFCSLSPSLFTDYTPSNFTTVIFQDQWFQLFSINPDDHFESFYSALYGRCFRFNSGKNMTNHTIPIKNSTYGGQLDSFIVQLWAPFGLAVWVHNKSSPPNIDLKKISNFYFVWSF